MEGRLLRLLLPAPGDAAPAQVSWAYVFGQLEGGAPRSEALADERRGRG